MTQEKLKSILHYEPTTGIFTWINSNKIAGRLSKYYQIQHKNKKYYSHRLAWLYMTGKFPDNQIDHINRIKTDNRFSNLRDVTCKENIANKRKSINASDGYYINYRKDTNMYNLTISRALNNGKRKHLGTYKTEEEAITAKQRLISPIKELK